MTRFVVRRLVGLVPLLLVLSVAVFLLVYLIPGDPAVTLAGGEAATPERVAEVREQLGFDEPVVVQYGDWLADAVRLDFGESLYTGRAVGDELRDRVPVTASVVLVSVVFALLVGIPLGVLGGMRPGTKTDSTVTAVASLGIAMPSFWLAMILIIVFGLELSWLPVRGYVAFAESPWEWLRHLILPSVALGTLMGATLARQLRGALADVLEADYVRTARAKGLSPVRVVGKHAFKNAAMPAVTVLGLQIAYLFGGTVIIEQIFAIPGVGTYMVNAIVGQDVPIIQGGIMMLAVFVVLANLAVDLTYGFLNPKVRVA
jgi:peptide/nickel transport system permease protein